MLNNFSRGIFFDKVLLLCKKNMKFLLFIHILFLAKIKHPMFEFDTRILTSGIYVETIKY